MAALSSAQGRPSLRRRSSRNAQSGRKLSKQRISSSSRYDGATPLIGRNKDMRISRIKKLWREGKPAVGGWLSIPHCVQAEVMAHTGLDWLCIDMQHGC